MEKIGLITITYNSADVISGFLDSTLKQSYKNFEIFIIDNDSQDDTEKVIFQYDDPRINFIKNSENLGGQKQIIRELRWLASQLFSSINYK